MNDKNGDVRKEFLNFTHKLLTNFNIIYLRKYEANLVIFFLNGLSDPLEDIIKMANEKMDQAGEYRKVR